LEAVDVDAALPRYGAVMIINGSAMGVFGERTVGSVSMRDGGRRSSRCFSISLGLLGLLGCSGSKQPGTRPPPADGPVDGVVVTGHLLCHAPSGDTTVAWSPGVLQAFFLGGDGAYQAVGIRGGANDQVELDIPDGVRYLLQVGTYYYETDQRTVDVTVEEDHRCNPWAPLAQDDTPVTVTVSKTGSYTQGSDANDSLIIQSFSTGYGFFNAPFTVSPDATSITSAIVLSKFTPLVDAGAGDDLHVFHLRSETIRDPARLRSAQFTHLLDTFAPTVTLQSGQPATISGALQPTTANHTIRFTSDRTKFDADYGGLVAPGRMTVALLADPQSYGVSGVTLAGFELITFAFGSSTASVQPWTFSNVAYADPFPDTWKRTLLIDYLTSRRFRHPSGSLTSWLAVNEQRVPFTGALEVGPSIHPPTHPRIGDANLLAGGKVTFGGTAPVAMSWTASDDADYYDVSIIQLMPNGNITEIAALRTTQTTLAIPPKLFTAGAFYVITLAATAGPADYAGGHIMRFEQQTRTASVISGRLRFIATCGDGLVQPGEDCDTAGESAGCNVDCTLPLCGDGLRNAAAGEACDTAGDTLGCNATCTLPTCGDNYHNIYTEDCDDGDVIDSSNGCSATCTFNHVCGDRRVEFGEGCDGGGVDTSSCNADCVPSQCGDGHVNTAAGEECDDGRLNNDTGHCTTACKLHL